MDEGVVISQRLLDAAATVQSFCDTLTPEELKIADMSNFDAEKQVRQWYSSRGNLFSTEDEACTHTLSLIDIIKDALEANKKRRAQRASRFAAPKLLSRFIRLPPTWRVYVRTRIFAEYEDSSSENEEKDGDDRIAIFFAKLQTEKDHSERKKNDEGIIDQYYNLMDKYDRILKEAEAEQE